MKYKPVIIFFILFLSCNNYKKVFKDFGLHSYYLAINVEYNKQVMPIVIENAEFYSLIKDDSLSEKEYVDMLGNLLSQMNSFEINRKMLYDKLEAYRVDIHGSLIKEYADKKGDDLITIFFNEDGVQSEKLSNEEKKVIIHLLFKKNIFVKIDDETGFIYIP